jgi:hypothetical protein
MYYRLIEKKIDLFSPFFFAESMRLHMRNVCHCHLVSVCTCLNQKNSSNCLVTLQNWSWHHLEIVGDTVYDTVKIAC